LENIKLNKRLALPLFWTILIFYFSLKPSSQNSSSFLNIEGMDKVVHFGCYLILAASWLFYFNPTKEKNSLFYYVFISISMIGILVEVLQDKMNLGREFDIYDMVANALGAMLGVLLYRRFSHLLVNL
jgi:VanZ family protein